MENRRHNSCQQHNCEIISKDRNKITQNKYAQYQKHHPLPVDARKKQRHHRTGCSHCQSKQTDQQTGLCDTDTKFSARSGKIPSTPISVLMIPKTPIVKIKISKLFFSFINLIFKMAKNRNKYEKRMLIIIQPITHLIYLTKVRQL